MQYLGNTYEEIAGEKAGIIRSDTPVVYFDKRPESSRVIAARAAELGTEAVRVGDDQIQIRQKKYEAEKCSKNSDKFSELTETVSHNCIDFSYESEYYKYIDLKINSSALYQTQNAALSVSVAEVLQKEGVAITEDDIRRGLASAFWTCRMEEIRPGFYIDGAHNADGIRAFLDSTDRIHCFGRKKLVFGVVDDKQFTEMVNMILSSGIFDSIYVTVLRTARSVDIDTLRGIFENARIQPAVNRSRVDSPESDTSVFYYSSAEEAVEAAWNDRTESDVIFAAGSLYLAGQIKEIIQKYD
jgi:dihydrofolate synthase/folylpolyglutamate synthase